MRPLLLFVLLTVPAAAQTLLYDTRPAFGWGGNLAMYGATAAALEDVDGDGVNDYVVGRPGPVGSLFTQAGGFVVHSGADGRELTNVIFFGDSEDHPGHLGTSLVPASDRDGDGVGDFVAGAPGWFFSSPFGSGTSERTGEVRVYSSADASLLDVWTNDDSKARFGATLANVGDVDGDSIDDMVVGAPGADFIELRSGVDGTVLERVDGPIVGAGFGAALAVVGNIAGDAQPEIAVVSSTAARVDVIQLDGTFVWGADEATAALDVADVDADGVLDVIVGRVGGGVRAYDGTSGDVQLDIQSPSVGYPLLAIGDVDEDGHADFVGGLGLGNVRLVSGADGSIRTIERATVSGVGFAGAARLGDLDGDGIAEFGVGATSLLALGGALTFTGFPEWSVFTTRDIPVLPLDVGAVEGVTGAPILRASGATKPTHDVTVELFEAAPSAPGLIVLGARRVPTKVGLVDGASIYFPQTYQGGVLVPSPDVVLPIATDASGRWSATVSWPRLDPGDLLYAQAWIVDAAAPEGFAVSDALQFTTLAP